MKKSITEETLKEMFDQLLDEAGVVSVAGYDIERSKILKNCDPVAYRCELANYADSIRDDFEVEGY